MADENLNTGVVMSVAAAEVVTVPIDDTLSISGQAADAKAVGDALELKADRSELQNTVSVNGQTPDAQGLILINGGDIPVSSEAGAPTIDTALAALDGKTAADILMGDGSTQTIADAMESGVDRTADQIRISESDSRTVANAIASDEQRLDGLQENVAQLSNRTGADIKADGNTDDTIAQRMAAMDAAAVKTVNQVQPDAMGNVRITEVEFADNLKSDGAQLSEGEWIARTTGGAIAVDSGSAWLQRILGNRVHDDYVAESLTMTVFPMPRTVPAAITATLDEEDFEAAAGEAGTYVFSYTTEWSADPSAYGISVVGVPISGDKITVVWDGENDAVMTLDMAERHAPPAITATIDRDTFVAYVDESCTINLYYTTGWSEDPALYGITVTNDPISGDQIRVVYVQEERGTITPVQLTELVSTGWNLYMPALGYARVIKYSDVYGFKIGGTYSGIAWAATVEGTRQAITPDANGLFTIPGDGYVFVTGGSDLNTYILMTWSDWSSGPAGGFAEYTESGIDLSTVMGTYFEHGMFRVGDVRDELDLQNGQAISRIDRWEYTENNLATAEASGRAYEYDENYIYIVRTAPVITDVTVANVYNVNDHGMEIVDSTVAPYIEILYGMNLKDKLRREVITFHMTIGELLAMS